MKICPHCHEEVEDGFDICWNCNYCFPEGKVLEENEPVYGGMRSLECLRCKVPMRYAGEYNFHEGTRIGFMGDLFELLQNRERFDLYVCPSCGKVEFFLPEENKR